MELIKDGKPITPTSGNGTLLYDQTDGSFTGPRREPITESPKKMSATQQNSANGNVKNDKSPSGAVEVQRGVVGQASEAGQVEHVLIKKKPKCKCCVIQ